jgi:hypothetical protein
MDFGVQAAVAKFVAEHEAKGDHLGSSRCASTGAVILAAAGLFGIAVIAGLAYFVPTLFHDMPASLYRDVRISIVLVGSSLCVGLGTSAFGSVFSGLQQYRVPIGISIVNRLLFAVAVGAAVFFNKSLLVMSAAVAAINTGTASALFFAWRAWASRIRITITAVNVSTLRDNVSLLCFAVHLVHRCPAYRWNGHNDRRSLRLPGDRVLLDRAFPEHADDCHTLGRPESAHAGRLSPEHAALSRRDGTTPVARYEVLDDYLVSHWIASTRMRVPFTTFLGRGCIRCP